MTRPLVIVGAGIGGLATALALKQRGIASIVIERRRALPDEGAGIQIGPNGARVLRRLGLGTDVEAVAAKPDCIVVHDAPIGRELTRLPLGVWMADRHGAPYLVTQRADLSACLYKAVLAAGGEVRFDCEVSGLDASAGRVDVTLTDATRIEANGVIGADGVWSRVRALMFDRSAPTMTGRVAARAVLPPGAFGELAPNAVHVWMAPRAHLVVYPCGVTNRLNAVLITQGRQESTRWSEPLAVATATERLALFRFAQVAAQAEQWRQWPLVAAPRLTSYARDRVALIGDAAHAMLPFLAQGAVMALEDAEALAFHVERSKGLMPQAFSAYAAARYGRTQRVVRAAARNGQIYHASGPLAGARNAGLRLMPPERIMRGYDWLYGGATEVPI